MTPASKLRIIFDKFSKTSIKKINGDYFLVGKYVDCQLIGTSWDVFIHDTKPIKLSPRVTVWKVEDIRDFIEQSNLNGGTHE